jgi:hypothetical protein
MRDTIEMAREAGAMFEHMMWLERDLAPVFQRFEALVRADEREALQAEVLEQCRINGMSAEREDALRAELTQLKASIALDKMADNARELGLDYEPAVQEGRDWSLLEATQESLREHMAEIKRLKAAQPAPVKTYSGGKPWPVAPAPDPAPIIQQLVTALEGSGTRMRSDQWYIEIEAVAAGKFYLNSKGEGL